MVIFIAWKEQNIIILNIKQLGEKKKAMSRCCGYWDQRSSDIKLQLSSSFTTFLNEAFCNKGSSNCRTRLLCFMLKQKTLSFISVQWCSIWKKPNEMTPCIPVWKVGLRTVKVAKVWVKYFYHDIFPYFPFAVYQQKINPVWCL